MPNRGTQRAIERRARTLSVLFTEIVVGLGAVGCAPAASPGGAPDEARVPTATPPAERSSPAVAPGTPTPPATSRIEERPPVVQVGGECDAGVKSSRVADGGANLVHGLNPKEPIDYIELVLFGLGDGGSVLMASGKKCGSAKDWRTCLSSVGRAAPPGGSGFRPGCIPGGCNHGLIVNRGDDVFVLSSPGAIADFLGPIDTPTEALLIAFSNEWTAKELPKGTCDVVKGLGIARTKEGAFEFVASKMLSSCPITTATAKIRVGANGDVKELVRTAFSNNGPCAGRRPAGFAGPPAAPPGTDPVGAYLLDLACLEAASIGAFADLARELEEHHAPRSMVRAAKRAKTDEIAHARRAVRQARRYGAVRGRARGGPPPSAASRTLAELARENEIEGCVREAYGALVATYQAAHASDPKLASMFETIARDETRHFALALELRELFRSRLSPREWRAVEESRRLAVEELYREIETPADPRLNDLAGVPSPEVARGLLDELAQATATSAFAS